MRKTISVLLCLCMALSLLPVTALAVETQYTPVAATNFKVYQFANGDATDTVINTIDLNTPVHISFDGAVNSISLLPVTGSETPNGREISSGFNRVYADDVMELKYTSYSSSIGTSYISSVGSTFDPQTGKWSAGMSLQYQAGDDTLYVQPDTTYRFLIRDGSDTSLRYSDVYTITDSSKLTQSQGTVTASFYDGKTASGAYTGGGTDRPITRLPDSGTFYLHLSGFTGYTEGTASQFVATKISLIGCSGGSAFSDEYQLWPSSVSSDATAGMLLDKHEYNTQILDGFKLRYNPPSGTIRGLINPGSYRVKVAAGVKTYISNKVVEVYYQAASDKPTITTASSLPNGEIDVSYSSQLAATPVSAGKAITLESENGQQSARRTQPVGSGCYFRHPDCGGHALLYCTGC